MNDLIPRVIFCPGGNEYYSATGDAQTSMIIGIIWTVTLIFLVGAIYGYFRKVNTLKSVIVLILIVLVVSILNLLALTVW